tara:strand:+ start:3690 stop:5936 length:2247 start_codon:yes stop_codon:yes gene_type:complete
MIKVIKSFFSTTFVLFFLVSFAEAKIIKNIIIKGNDRISDETIIMFSDISIGQDIETNNLNEILKILYETNYFKNVSTLLQDDSLIITVDENPIIGDIEIKGVKAKKNIAALKKNLKLKTRSSFNEFLLESDKKKIFSNLKDLGYYFAKVKVYIKKNDNKIYNIIYDVDVGEKAKIYKITFTGNKFFKDGKLKSVIISEEYKPWKFISGKKYLNENIIEIDARLLKNFYLNNGFYNAQINSSFAKLIDENNFELIFNINSGKKFFFNDLNLILPTDFNNENFEEVYNLFSNLKNKPYSFNRIEKILKLIDTISTNEQFESSKSSVVENIIDNKINLDFIIEDVERSYVEKINILNNNVTRENVIRNQLELDEGDPYNDILAARSINNIKSLNFFKEVKSDIIAGKKENSKIINITVEEKPTGEIMAGAGIGTSGGTISVGVKENNYLGKGININANLTLNEDSIKGLFSLKNPNFNNSDKSITTTIQSSETNRLTDFGYKTNKTGASISTSFEYLDDFDLGLGIDSFFEKIETDSTASARQKKQSGNYFDNFINLKFDYDKRNQKFQTTDGFRSFYKVDLPIISKTNTLSNTYSFNNYSEIFNRNILKTSFFFKSALSITSDDIKLSERINIPSNKLRGFEYGKIGPKDGDDYIGGNFVSAVNFSSTLPQILENSQSTDFIIFLDIASVWGVDYDSSLGNSNDIRTSVGIGLDWYSAIGPINFSLAQPITKDSNDKTESFRFNLGTTF